MLITWIHLFVFAIIAGSFFLGFRYGKKKGRKDSFQDGLNDQIKDLLAAKKRGD